MRKQCHTSKVVCDNFERNCWALEIGVLIFY